MYFCLLYVTVQRVHSANWDLEPCPYQRALLFPSPSSAEGTHWALPVLSNMAIELTRDYRGGLWEAVCVDRHGCSSCGW